jgi:hypothetical protein
VNCCWSLDQQHCKEKNKKWVQLALVINNGMTNYEKLQKLISISGNCVNLGRSLKSKHPDCYQWILENTKFLDKSHVSMNERIYCVVNNIQQVVVDAWNHPARFVNLFKGYSLKTISKNKHDRRKSKSAAINKLPSKKLSKLEQFKVRNKKRNSSLYLPSMKEGIDYIVCPVSQERLSFIKNNYITNILEMDPIDYWSRYPDIQRCSTRRSNNIKKAFQDIDPNTGLTKHATAITRALTTKNTPDEYGVTIHQKIGQKSRSTHLSKIDNFGRNGYERLAHYRTSTIMADGRRLEDHAHDKRSERIAAEGVINKKRYGASKISKKHLAPILSWLNTLQLKYYFDTNEFVVRDTLCNRNYFFDLVIPDLKTVVEYQGTAYHAWPMLTDNEWQTWRHLFTKETAEQRTLYEYQKARAIYSKYGYTMWYVWTPTAQTDVSNILCYLKTVITKS